MHDDQPEPPAFARRILLVIGASGLLLAMATDALAVLGRHSGFAVTGAIEIFQVCAVVALSSAILLATISERHAAVDLIVGRLSPGWQRGFAIAGRAAAVLAFAALAAGSFWVTVELWPTHEMTEQLAIPLAGFRAFWLVCCSLAGLWSLAALLREVRR